MLQSQYAPTPVSVLPKEISAEDVLSFWFSEKMRTTWFNSTPIIDKEIIEHYLPLWKVATEGHLNDWSAEPRSCLALIIVLDQFPLNMFRGQPKSFASEAQALSVTRFALDRGFEKQYDSEQKLFLFLPLMHSENPVDQDMSVSLFAKSGLDTRWAEHHRDIVHRFGRFPHRNAILGRISSREELEFLNSDKAYTG